MDASGGRYELRRESSTSGAVAYAGQFTASAETWHGRFELDLVSGAVRESFESAAQPPEWLLANTRAVLRALWRAHGEQLRAWPPRIARWRPEARGALNQDA